MVREREVAAPEGRSLADRAPRAGDRVIPTVITSFTEDYYQLCGKDFVDTFRAHWPKDTRLVVYYEGVQPREDWHFFDEVSGWDEWERCLRRFPLMCGVLGDTYNIQFDARHWRKAFMESHAASIYGGKIFWIDADTITHQDVPEGFLDEVLPDDKLACYLGRDRNWGHLDAKGRQIPCYTESGFIGFNASHELCRPFFDLYLNIFKSGASFTLDGWHDCTGFDAARKLINRPELFVDLAADCPDGTAHPFVNSVLGKYMDHRKGRRKRTRSAPEDLKVERTEDYWREVGDIRSEQGAA